MLSSGDVTEEDLEALSLFRMAKHSLIAAKLIEMKSELTPLFSIHVPQLKLCSAPVEPPIPQ